MSMKLPAREPAAEDDFSYSGPAAGAGITTKDNSLTIGTRLHELVRCDWKEYVIDYGALAQRLIDVKLTFGLRRVLSTKSINVETRSFAEVLDREVEKVVLFYIRQQGVIAEKLWNLRSKEYSTVDGDGLATGPAEVEEACAKYRLIGRVSATLLIYNNKSLADL
jgi:hypothetical protein